MTRLIELDEDHAIAPDAPDAADLDYLRHRGFRSVVNLRDAGEADQKLSPEREGDEAGRRGLSYLHFPVTPDQLGPDRVRGFRKALAQLAKPVAIHCASGKRAGLMTIAARGEDRLAAGLEAVRAGGIDLPEDRLRAMMSEADQ